MAFIARQSPLLRQSCLSAFRSSKNVAGAQALAFHASAKKNILPPLPQSLPGTVNDPVPVPHAHPTHGSYHWVFERIVAVGLVPLCVAPFAAGTLNPVMDSILCSLIVLHSHVGFQSSITDYFPGRRVPKTKTGLEWLLRFFTLGTAVGLYEFETNDVGVTEAIKRVWKA